MTDETQRMAEMRQWLEAVCAELELDPALLDETTEPLLDLIHDVAHGPSRPGAPLTAFLVGLAAGRHVSADTGDQEPARLARAILERSAAVDALLRGATR